MKLLFDTHIWLWALLEPSRFSARAQATVEDTDNEVWLSPISAWETMLLIERDRVRITGSPAVWIENACLQFPVRDAPLTREVAVASRSVQLSHQDPADRFLAATAAVYGLTLLTADARLLSGKGYDVANGGR